MIDYPWPGTVRELEHTIKRAVALCEDHEVDPFELSHGALAQPVPPPPRRNHYRELNEVEREHIEHMLRTFNNNKTQTARALGIDRKTLWHKLRKYHILGT
jgi:two-component system response regulator HydG